MNNGLNIKIMKKIKIWADVHSTGIFSEIGAFFLKEQTTITDETWQELLAWVDEYDIITTMNDNERENFTDKIISLDFKGLELMHKIEKEWSNDVETNEELNFLYYSEGLMKFL